MGGFLCFITSYISLVWNIAEWWSWAWSGFKWWSLENAAEIAAFVHLLQALCGGFVCLGGVVCLQCLSHTGAVVTGECFPVSSEEDVWVPSDTLHGLFWGWCLCAGCKVYQRRSKSRWMGLHVPLVSLSCPAVSGKGTWLIIGNETSS